MRVFYSGYSDRQQKLLVAIGISMPKRILEPMIRLVMLLNPHLCGYSSFRKIKIVAGFSMKDGTTKKTPLPW